MSTASLPLFAHEVSGSSDDAASWVTFVPGIGNDRSFWADQARRLGSKARVLLLDPWGQGDAPPPPPGCGFDDIVEGLFVLWDHLGIENSALVGLGFGGSVALAAALARPARVSAVVACCCRPRQPDDRRDFWRERRARAAEIGMARMADITVDRWLSEEFRKGHPAIDQALREAMARSTVAGYQAYVDAFIEMDFTDRLGEIACPVQLVAAENDHGGGPVPAMETMARAIPNASLTIIPGVGHICVAEAPEELARIIAAFLAASLPIAAATEPASERN